MEFLKRMMVVSAIAGILVAPVIAQPTDDEGTDAAEPPEPVSLTLSLSGMDLHVGQRLQARLINKATRSEARRVTVPEIVGGELDVVFEGLPPGRSFFVDFFADVNGNGIYDPPPEDHAWRISADDVAEDTVVEFAHNTDFATIFWKY